MVRQFLTCPEEHISISVFPYTFIGQAEGSVTTPYVYTIQKYINNVNIKKPDYFRLSSSYKNENIFCWDSNLFL